MNNDDEKTTKPQEDPRLRHGNFRFAMTIAVDEDVFDGLKAACGGVGVPFRREVNKLLQDAVRAFVEARRADGKRARIERLKKELAILEEEHGD